MKIVNLTPHAVRVIEPTGETVFPPTHPPARLRTFSMGTWGGDFPVRVEMIGFGRIEDVPAPEDGVWYIVSLPTALAAVGDRDDFLVPYDEVRSETGQILGCRMLAKPM